SSHHQLDNVLGGAMPTAPPRHTGRAIAVRRTSLTLAPVWDAVTPAQQEQWRVPAFPVAGERVLIAAGDEVRGAAVARAIRERIPDAVELGTAPTIDAI